MKICILMGSPRKNGNTAALLSPFINELKKSNVNYEYIWLYDKEIKPCIACRACQKDWTKFGCPINDSVQNIFDSVYSSDVIVFATPIYSWYCTAPMKALLDRLVYGMNKYYGEEIGPALWEGKFVSLVTTCGYSIKTGPDLFEDGIKRYCKHSKLCYTAMLAERQANLKDAFMDAEKALKAEFFARKLIEAASQVNSNRLTCLEDFANWTKMV